MMRRLLGSRGMVKFRRNRLAMAALAVIGVYFAIAVAIMFFGVLTLRDARERVLPNRQYGFLQAPTLEERYDRVRWYVKDHLSKALDSSGITNPKLAPGLLESVAMAERHVADVPVDRLLSMWKDLKSDYKSLDDAWLDREDLLDEATAIRMEITDAHKAGKSGDVEELEGELKALQPDLDKVAKRIPVLLDKAEAGVRSILPWPGGWDGLVYGFRTFLGSDASGRSIAVRAFYSIKIAFQIGMVTAVVSVMLGALLGAAAGFFGGWVDHVVMWVVSTLSSVPYLVLLAVLVYMFMGNKTFDNPTEHPGLALVPVYAAFCLTFWIGTCRVIRGEVMKIKELEYVQAATAIGFGRVRIMIRHVIPNTAHLMFINFSLLFIGAIKSEVILSFLNLGVKGQPSWGIMISQAKDDVANFFFWEVLSATALMFVLLLAFNIVSDALQDAFDPRHVS